MRTAILGNFVLSANRSEARVRGPPYYGALALLPLDKEVTLVSAANPNDVEKVLDDLRGAILMIRPCRKTTRLEEGKGWVRLVERGCRVPVDQVVTSAISYSVVVVDPVVGEVDESSIGELYKASRLLSVNLRGFVRKFEEGGFASRRWDWARLKSMLRDVDLAYARVEDVPPAEGDPVRAAEVLLGLGARSVAVASEGGVYVGSGRGLYFLPTSVEGEGDDEVFLAVSSYVFAISRSPPLSLTYGAAAVELKRSKRGYPWYRAVDLESHARTLELKVRRVGRFWG